MVNDRAKFLLTLSSGVTQLVFLSKCSQCFWRHSVPVQSAVTLLLSFSLFTRSNFQKITYKLLINWKCVNIIDGNIKRLVEYCRRFWSRYVTVTLPHRYLIVTSPLPHRYLTVSKINVRFRINNFLKRTLLNVIKRFKCQCIFP